MEHNGHILTLANSIIGVSILAMPYCFKQCGILLAVVMLLLSNLISRLSCHFLIKSAIIARRKTFEYLAYYIFGGFGKFAIEVGMIGFLIGTCIAFFVVMGDLGPEIISEITGHDTTSTMRSTILLTLALFCVLPLGLLKNIDSLAGVSKATIGFYFCLVVKVVIDAVPHIFYRDWTNKVFFWRPAGIIQCLPIFSMALSCQTQLFEIYQVLHNPSLEKMNHVIKNAVNICTLVYFFVGFFGYITFANKHFTGNILLSFAPSLMTNIIKLGFILSIAFSFPLVIFPCRASLHSLFYKKGMSVYEGATDYIPEWRFKGLTLVIVTVSLVVGILIPNIEFVLGLVGSSIGIMICVLFPVICFIHISQKETNERLLAKGILVIGLVVMILGTYRNLHQLETIQSSPVVTNIFTENRKLKLNIPDKSPTDIPDILNGNVVKQSYNVTKIEILLKVTESPDIRHEPPQPLEPQDSQPDSNNENAKSEAKKISNLNENVELPENVNTAKEAAQTEKQEIVEINHLKKEENIHIQINAIDQPELKHQAQVQDRLINEAPNSIEKVKNDDVDIEAIQNNEKESLVEENKEVNDNHIEEHKILIDQIQKQNKVQEELVKQQKQILEVIEKQQEQNANEEKLKAEIKAVKEIESIALKAIEKISGDVNKNEQIVAELEKDVLQKVNVSIQIKENTLENNSPDDKSKQNTVKIEQLKLMNDLISAKIKQNNITQNQAQNTVNQNANQTKIQNLNQEQSKQFGPDFLNVSPFTFNKSNSYNNTAPLLVNLGQLVNKIENGSNKDNLKPLPLIVSSYLQEEHVNFSESQILGKTNQAKTIESNQVNKKAVPDEDAKVMRRDILSYKPPTSQH